MNIISNKEEILDACDILEVARTLGVDIQGSGNSWAIRCPYHYAGTKIDQHIGNCYITKDRKHFKCVSCGNSGDAITLVRQINDCNFPDAMKYLSEITGIELKKGKNAIVIENDDNVAGPTSFVPLTMTECDMLGIDRSPVYVNVESTFDFDTYKTWKENGEKIFIETELDRKPDSIYKEDLYVRQKMVCANPLNEWAKADWKDYSIFVSERVKEVYQQTILLYKLSDFPEIADKQCYNELSALRNIAKKVGMSLEELPYPTTRR